MGAIFGYSGPFEEDQLARMDAQLHHRGSRKNLNILSHAALGLRTLFDDSDCRRMGEGMYADEHGGIGITGLLTDGPGKGNELFLSELLESYRTQGPEFVRLLRGNFVLAIVEDEQVFLARDAAGGRAIYYARHAGGFLFASEPKAILTAPGFPRRLRAGGVAQYLTFSFLPGSCTLIEGLHELPAGHTLSWQPGQPPRVECFWKFEDCEETGEQHKSSADWPARFRAAFGNAVQDRLPENEPVALFLSGGLDSSVVAAEAAGRRRQPVQAFAIHFGENYPHELEFARSVAARTGLPLEEFCIRPREFLPRLREMIWHLDDAIGDPITMPNYELSARAARDFRFAFNGEGGDPLFGGPKNIPMLLQHWYGGVERSDRFREQAYLASYRRGYEEISRLFTPEFSRQIDEAAELEQVLTPFFQADRPRSFLHKLAAINIRLKGAHLILPKVERMTAAHGLTPLSPLFDERLLELCFAMPPAMRLSGGIEKVIIKKAYQHDLPAEIINRPKSGMRVPVHYWFRGELKRYARNILGSRQVKQAGIFNPARVKQLLDYNTEEGPGRYGLRLWMLLTFEIWRRIVLEQEGV